MASNKYEQFNFEDLKEKDVFQSWLKSKSSSLFLVHGLTLHSQTGFSWLSPAALDVVDWLNTRASQGPDKGRYIRTGPHLSLDRTKCKASGAHDGFSALVGAIRPVPLLPS